MKDGKIIGSVSRISQNKWISYRYGMRYESYLLEACSFMLVITSWKIVLDWMARLYYNRISVEEGGYAFN